MFETAYVAHQNDLYQVVYNPTNGDITRVVLFADNASLSGEEVLFWRLPLETRKRILHKVERERSHA